MRDVLQGLRAGRMPGAGGLGRFVDGCVGELAEELFAAARETARRTFGNRVYVRALIEFTNYCAQDCLYCGIRRSNARAQRYRLSPEEILECCGQAHNLGFRTFVLQGGEDPWFHDGRLTAIVASIKENWPDSALTLSVGERSRESYRALRQAGADRFLLRHESADAGHFALLHPPGQNLASRLACLDMLKELGFQTGAGFMVGSPEQKTEHLVADLEYLWRFQPEMVGIGPFLPHSETPFAARRPGSPERTLILLAITRLLLPAALIPATTALNTAADDGRTRGILAGANVIMPNVSPRSQREKYMLYDGKKYTGGEAGENLAQLCREVAAVGYEVVMDRGDYAPAGACPANMSFACGPSGVTPCGEPDSRAAGDNRSFGHVSA